MNTWRFGEDTDSVPGGPWGVDEWSPVLLTSPRVILLLLTHGPHLSSKTWFVYHDPAG